ncbi:MAG: type II secretion system GspH family protein [Lentisphaeraceae bacterium]|nr:type II secretion system GspH family protein [Lentisphaeraceae bacterium]
MQKKFTLIELLVVVAIIGILASMLLPSLSKAREAAKVAVCVSNAKQTGAGLSMYTDDNSDMLPNVKDNANVPHKTRVAKTGGVWYSLGLTTQYSDPRVFYCPGNYGQTMLDRGEAFTYERYLNNNGDWNQEISGNIRTGFELLLEEKDDRENITILSLEEDDFLLIENLERADTAAHKNYYPGWTTMRTDMGAVHKRNKTVYALLESEGNHDNSWSLTEAATNLLK